MNANSYKYSIDIVEGFDYVGKTAVINLLRESMVNPVVYHPDYKLFDKVLSRNYAFMYCYGQADLLTHIEPMNLNLIYDRAIISSYVYDRLYGDGTLVSYELVKDYFNKLLKSGINRLTVTYVYHESDDSARRILSNDKDHNDKLDHFKDFEDYKSTYFKAHKLYLDLFDNLSKDFPVIDFRYIKTNSNSNGDKVSLTSSNNKFAKLVMGGD